MRLDSFNFLGEQVNILEVVLVLSMDHCYPDCLLVMCLFFLSFEGTLGLNQPDNKSMKGSQKTLHRPTLHMHIYNKKVPFSNEEL